MKKFIPDVYNPKFEIANYQSPDLKVDFFARYFPSLAFYYRLFFGPFQWICHQAHKGNCDDYVWVHSSACVADAIESVGVKIDIQGLAELSELKGPFIFAANHMSVLETFILPAILQPRWPTTIAVKKSLPEMPFFGKAIKLRDCIVLERTNPRKDLETILKKGTEKLEKGSSLLIFPQSTRNAYLTPNLFSSITVKLARRAKVAVVPIALKTDAWGQGRFISDIGWVKRLPVHLHFGSPIAVVGNGKEEQQQIYEFIFSKLKEWQLAEGVNSPKKPPAE